VLIAKSLLGPKSLNCYWCYVSLLCSNADRDAKNMDGKTALEVAQLNEQQEVVDALTPEKK